VTLYQIINWDATYENYKSRTCNACGFYCVPNKQSGLGYLRLLAHVNGQGPAMYGAFVAVVLLASKQRKPRSGWLTDTGKRNGSPLTPEDLGLTTGLPSGLIKVMLDACASPSVGWISAREVDDGIPASVPQDTPPDTAEGARYPEGRKVGLQPKLRRPTSDC